MSDNIPIPTNLYKTYHNKSDMDTEDNFEDITFNLRDIAHSSSHVPCSILASGIHRAVLEGNLQGIKQLIDAGVSVNEVEDGFGFRPLHLAAIKNDTEILEYLLARDGVDVDVACDEDKTPLYYAAALDHVESVERLCRYGADPNLPDSLNNAPLHVSLRRPDVCHLLLRHGADADAVDEWGYAPLHDAVRNSFVETVHVLLYYGADSNVADDSGLTPFMTAVIENNLELQRILFDYVDDLDGTVCNEPCFTSILSQALETNSPLARDMMERGADVNYGDRPDVIGRIGAFETSLFAPVDVSTFRMVWERLRYNDCLDTIDLVEFLNYAEAVPKFLPVILESDRFRPVVEFLSKGENYRLFVDKFAEYEYDLDQLTVLTCRLLQEGFRASSYDIHAIFRHYGHCELFRILLYMNNNFARGWLPRMALCRLFCDVKYDLDKAVADLSDIPKEDLLQWLEYNVVSASVGDRYRDDEQMCRILDRLPKVPTLIERSRNVARKYLRRIFKPTTLCRFYTAIDNLPIPSPCKIILKFGKKLYVVE